MRHANEKEHTNNANRCPHAKHNSHQKAITTIQILTAIARNKWCLPILLVLNTNGLEHGCQMSKSIS